MKACIWNGKRPPHGRRRYRLGEFPTAEAAARAFDAAAVAIWGARAVTNFPVAAGAVDDAARRAMEAGAVTDSDASDTEGRNGDGRECRYGSPPDARSAAKLRAAAEAEAQCEVRAMYIGVWRRADGPWKATLWKGDNGQKRTLHLGSFGSPPPPPSY